MIATLSSSRSAIALNWRDSSEISIAPVTASRVGTRLPSSPRSRSLAAVVSRRSGVVNRRARNAATATEMRKATIPTTMSRPVTAAMVEARKVYGFDRVTCTPHGTGARSPTS